MNKLKKQLKILEITAFSAGICGVWTRVLAESSLLAKKGYEVHVFSSNIFRGGEKKIAKDCEIIDNVNVKRFPAKFSFGENTYFWNFEKEVRELNPDIIVVHAYRQYYSTRAIAIANKLGIPCFLVTHAPFLEKKLRSWKLNLAVSLYDRFIGRNIINKYKKILAITQWEIPSLLKLGAKRDKIIYVPNGVPEEFFNIKLKDNKNKIPKILFLGRIAPIKDLETLIRAIKLIEKENFHLDIVGPAEQTYFENLRDLIKRLSLESKISFYPAIYDLRKKIAFIDGHDIFLLTSKREAMPQALIEAMARKKIVISSRTDGGKEIVKDGYNGYLFDIENENQLALAIKNALNLKKQGKIMQNARNSVKKFSWKELSTRLEKIYTS